jgi:hypothetical protein
MYMRRIHVGIAVAALVVTTAGELSAQRCRTTRDGRVTVCERDRDRHRDDRHGRRRDAGPIELGIRGGYDFEDDVGLAGAQLRIPLIRQLALVPSADVFFDESRSDWQINADAIVKPDVLGGVYLGVGAAFLSRDFDESDLEDDQETEVGLNVVAGLDGGRIGGTVLRPFVEGRWTSVDDYDAFRLSAGINIPVSRRGLW